MAWISVHEQVLGAKLRSLAKNIGSSQNEALGVLVRLWLWGINNADKEGKIVGAEKEDVAEVLATGIDKRYSAEQVVEALIDTKWIDLENGLYIHDWEEWQEQWYKAIETREKNAERKREERKRKRLSRTQNEEQVQAIFAEKMGITKNAEETILPKPKLNIPHIEEQKSKTENATEYPEGFNQFWEVYPRKVGKGDAFKKYKARINCGWRPEQLIEAAKNYASKVIREHTEKQYIKHPKTFLSDSEPFIDFLPRKEYEDVQANVESTEDNPYADWS